MTLSPSAATLLATLVDLGGTSTPGDLAAATGIPTRTVTDAIKALRAAGLVEGPKGRVLLTAAGRARHVSADPVGASTLVADALDVWAGLGLYPHRAFLELLLSATVARHHLPVTEQARHLGFVAIGETGTGKSAVAQMAMAVLGLDLVDHELYLPTKIPGEVIGRRGQRQEGGGYTWEPAEVAGRPLVLLDEFDKADEAVRKAALYYLDGRVLAQVEGAARHLAPTPVVAVNPPERGPRLALVHSAFGRRSAVLDTRYATDRGLELELALHEYYARPRAHLQLAQLRLPPGLPKPARDLLASLGNALTPAGRAAKPPLAALEAATLGRAALGADLGEHGVLLAALSVCVAYLTVTEQLDGQVAGGWHQDLSALREHLAGHGDVDQLEQVVAASRSARAQAQAQVARGRVARDVEDLGLVRDRHVLAEELRLAAEALTRKVPDVDKPAAKGLREALRSTRGEVLNCRSRGRLEDLRGVVAGALEQARAMRRRLDQEAAQQRADAEQAQSAQRQDRAIAQAHARSLEQQQRARAGAHRAQARARLGQVRERARRGEQLWKRCRTTAGEAPWRELEQLQLLAYEGPAPRGREGLLGRVVGVLSTVDGGTWHATGDPSLVFPGRRDHCPSLARWGEGTRAVLLPWLAPLHAEEDQLVAALGMQPRRDRPVLYRPRTPLALTGRSG